MTDEVYRELVEALRRAEALRGALPPVDEESDRRAAEVMRRRARALLEPRRLRRRI